MQKQSVSQLATIISLEKYSRKKKIDLRYQAEADGCS